MAVIRFRRVFKRCLNWVDFLLLAGLGGCLAEPACPEVLPDFTGFVQAPVELEEGVMMDEQMALCMHGYVWCYCSTSFFVAAVLYGCLAFQTPNGVGGLLRARDLMETFTSRYLLMRGHLLPQTCLGECGRLPRPCLRDTYPYRAI